MLISPHFSSTQQEESTTHSENHLTNLNLEEIQAASEGHSKYALSLGSQYLGNNPNPATGPSTQTQLYNILQSRVQNEALEKAKKQRRPQYRLEAIDCFNQDDALYEILNQNSTLYSSGMDVQSLISTFIFDPLMNQIPTQLRCCYTNDVKSAKDLKISMKGEHPYFYPNIPFNLMRGSDDEKLDLIHKKPLNIQQGLGTNPNPLQVIDDGAETLYNSDLDKFLLDNQMMVERYKTHRGISRLYSIMLYRDPKLDNQSNNALRFRLQASTGFLIKIGKVKYLLSTLSVLQHPQELMKLPGSKSFVLCSFGNRDLAPYIFSYLKDQRKTELLLDHKSLRDALIDKYYRVLTRIKPNKVALSARKEWLTNNSRCSEVLDSEFFYQLLPSLDMAVFDIEQNFLREREIKSIDFAKPDSRYTKHFSIGFTLPRHDFPNLIDFKNKYGCSKGVTRNENLVLSLNKSVSFGLVRSYGSVTSLVNSIGSGAQGSPCFNEMGKCWGFIVNSHNDIPEKWANQVRDEEELMRDIKKKIANSDRGGGFSSRNSRGRPFGGIKKDKKSKKDKKKKKKKRKLNESESEEESEAARQRRKQREKEAPLPAPISDSYFDIKSAHQLIPILPYNNSYNRNFALTFTHSGVRYIIDRLQALQDEYGELQRFREKLMKREKLRDETLNRFKGGDELGSDGIGVSHALRKLAQREGDIGLHSNLLVYDQIKEAQKNKPKPITYKSTDIQSITGSKSEETEKSDQQSAENPESEEKSIFESFKKK